MTNQEMEKLAEKYASELFSKDCEDIDVKIEWYNRYSNYLEGLKKATEYFQNSWSEGCKCKFSFGQTWCCNQCGLPYPTLKDKKNAKSTDTNS